METLMQTEKPKISRVYITVMDGETKKSKTQTVYGATRDQVMDAVLRGLKTAAEESPRKRTAKTAAA
jgi:hypothetical protein